MTTVVYILGAGFSAPLNIPTIAQFLQHARDQQEDNPGAFEYFARVFQSIKTLERANYHFSTNAESIEELLTLEDLIKGLPTESDAQLVKQFIADVIKYYTPPLTRSSTSQRWDDLLMGGRPWTPYVAFVAAILGCRFTRRTMAPGAVPTLGDYECRIERGKTRYAVISLNYDMVLETAVYHLSRAFPSVGGLAFEKRVGEGTPLVKLHGSIDGDNLVPPLWNKRYEGIRGAWDTGLDVLSTANDIRILGYSLPEADPFIRYLLRAAALRSKNLKRIDVFCRDTDGSVESRYDNFITFKGYRRSQDRRGKGRPAFVGRDADVFSYLAGITGDMPQWPEEADLSTSLERAHKRHFQ